MDISTTCIECEVEFMSAFVVRCADGVYDAVKDTNCWGYSHPTMGVIMLPLGGRPEARNDEHVSEYFELTVAVCVCACLRTGMIRVMIRCVNIFVSV